jgi:hypothetical protein
LNHPAVELNLKMERRVDYPENLDQIREQEYPNLRGENITQPTV